MAHLAFYPGRWCVTHGALYNENDPFASRWLEELELASSIAPGRVDSRSITELRPSDVAGLGQRHFFAGIGGWSYALRLAGVPDAASIWTGSCPCQPFSRGGDRRGALDPRHIWPAWLELIRECRPPIILGEQVASRAGLAWLDVVRADLEGCGYAFGASDLCAASVGAPHNRPRIFFVASVPLVDSDLARLEVRVTGDRDARRSSLAAGVARAAADPWLEHELAPCADGVRRPIPVAPELYPLAHGVPDRMVVLRGAGNAIVPQAAAAFVTAAIGALGDVARSSRASG